MSEHNRNSRAYGTLILAFAAVAGIAFGACKRPQTKAGGKDVSIAVSNACKDYCSQAKLCKEDLNEEKCRNDCNAAMSSCQADEQDLAVNELKKCSNESCDDFLGCTISVGAQCAFGI